MSVKLKNPNVLLVLGNGFDLQCGCYTSYVHFFDYLNHFPTYSWLFSLCDSYLETDDYHKRNDIVSGMFSTRNFPLWTIYFYCVNHIDEHKTGDWYDIENYLREFLTTGRIDSLVAYLRFNIPGLDSFSNLTLLMGDIIKLRYPNIDWENDGSAKKTLCDLLLEDLKNFERGFAKYVSDGYDAIPLKDVERKNLLQKIKDYFPNLSSLKICTFNYTHIPDEPKENVFNIHGTCDNPILGIDYIGDNDTEISIFAKKVRQRNDETISVPKEFLGDEKYTIVFYGLSFCQTDVDDAKSLASSLDESADIYVLYNQYYIDGILYNPRGHLMRNFMDFSKRVGFFHICSDSDFDRVRSDDGKIHFDELK